MGAIVNGLRGTELDTGIDPKLILPLSTYWEQVGGEGGGVDAPYLLVECGNDCTCPDCVPQTRELYAPFESNMKAVSSDVYLHEMPGGTLHTFISSEISICTSNHCHSTHRPVHQPQVPGSFPRPGQRVGQDLYFICSRQPGAWRHCQGVCVVTFRLCYLDCRPSLLPRLPSLPVT